MWPAGGPRLWKHKQVAELRETGNKSRQLLTTGLTGTEDMQYDMQDDTELRFALHSLMRTAD